MFLTDLVKGTRKGLLGAVLGAGLVYGGCGGKEYTCETGARMFLELCCPLLGGCGDGVEFLLHDCQNVRPDEYPHPTEFFACAYDVCAGERSPIEQNIRDCEDRYLD